MDRKLSALLHLLRGLAAILIVASHVRQLVLVDLEDAVEPTALTGLFYLLTGFGHLAVLVFLVSSGFLVGGATLARWRVQGVDLAGYALARASRLYCALIPALMAGFVLDLIGLTWLDRSALYSDPARYHTTALASVAIENLSPWHLLGNLMMLQDIRIATFGSNAALWLIAWIGWYYLLFGLLASAWFDDRAGRLRRTGLALLAAVLLVWLPQTLVLWSLVWLVGLGLHAWLTSHRWRPRPSAALVLALVCAVIAAEGLGEQRLPGLEDSIARALSRDLVLAFSIGLVMAGTSRLTRAQIERLMGRLALPTSVGKPLLRQQERLSGFALTICLAHFPILLFMLSLGGSLFGLTLRQQPSLCGWLLCLGFTALVLAGCRLVWWCGERHAPIVRQALARRLHRQRQPGSDAAMPARLRGPS